MTSDRRTQGPEKQERKRKKSVEKRKIVFVILSFSGGFFGSLAYGQGDGPTELFSHLLSQLQQYSGDARTPRRSLEKTKKKCDASRRSHSRDD